MWRFIGNDKVILASNSPRRKELLEETGLKFTIKPVTADETLPAGLSLFEGVIELSCRKAQTAAKGESEGWIIAADTMIELNNQPIGKPENIKEARAILEILSGRTHRVITGFTIGNIEREIFVSDLQTTSVTFYPLTESEIEAYLSSGESSDKAGAYGAQGFGGFLIERIDGCFFNVVGLPLAKLRRIWINFNQEILNGCYRR